MDEKVGIDNLKVGLGFGIGIANDVIASIADGKVTLSDAPRFMDDLFKIPGVIKAAPAMLEEVIDVDDEENAEIKTFVREKLQLPNADVSEVVDASIDVIFYAGELVEKIMVLAEEIKRLKKADANE